MARETPARKTALATVLSAGIDQVSATLHKLHAAYADRVVDAMRNPSASRHENALQPLRQPE
jgi:hypothetical protein